MNRLQELVAEARYQKWLAEKYYRAAMRRKDQIREERRAFFRHGAKYNPMFRDLLQDPRGLEAVVVAMLPDDPDFSGYVDDWRTSETLANSAASQVRMELALQGSELR